MDTKTPSETLGSIDEPAHVRAAPTHPNPYPYYARLAVEQPLYREGPTGAWVAASAEAVTAILTSPICYTRPAAGPVPQAIVETPVGEIYSRLVRLIDGEIHCPLKSTVSTALDEVNLSRLAETVRVEADQLAAILEPERDGERLTRFIYSLPVHVISGLLGVPPARFADVASWMGDYGAASAAAATSVPPLTDALLQAGCEGSRALLDLFGATLETLVDHDDHLFARLARHAALTGRLDSGSIIANGIGVMAQGFAATPALTGGALLALAREPTALAAVREDNGRLGDVIQEVLRCDPVTHSTPRFVARDGTVAGHAMAEGDMIVVTLAAASRDPALNREPNRFDISRDDRKYLEFGAGAHACPGGGMATVIAEVAVRYLLDRGIALDGLEARVGYRPSAHIRMPVFSR